MIDYHICENGWNDIDKKGLSDLIKESFDKKLVDDFFDIVNPKYVVIAEEDGNYAGTAIVEEAKENGNPLGFDYVNKLAVCKKKQKNGIANELMNIIERKSSAYVLRADPKNSSANKFYGDRGLRWNKGEFLFCEKKKEWNVYYNLTVRSSGLKERAVQYALEQPATLFSILK